MSTFGSVPEARAYLAAVAEPPAAALGALVDVFGPVRAAGRVRTGDVPDAVRRETAARRQRVSAVEVLRATESAGARLVTPEDSEWPAAAFVAFGLAGFPHLCAPLALWVRGPARMAELAERSAAIVGARAATSYGLHVAGSLGYGVADLGCAVVSGAAYGIDGAAHRGALAAGGTTVAVLACGVDRVYPSGHARLLGAIGEQGAVLSEYPPGSVPARHRFLVRNRLIAGLAAGTVVVEAGWRSGARRTASDAGLLGRPVMAVPGPVTSALSAGAHQLLREPGTVAVTRAEEVLEAVGRIGVDLAPPGGPVAEDPGRSASPTIRRVYEALPARDSSGLGELSAESGLPLDVVRSALPELAAAGLVARTGGGAWRRVARSPGCGDA
ncbi:MAG TPA: DNA-processing protein DprA [Pseudonocardia sp.]|jgi:DNA processing protein